MKSIQHHDSVHMKDEGEYLVERWRFLDGAPDGVALQYTLSEPTGRELARVNVPYSKPQDEPKIVFTTRGSPMHPLASDWLPLLSMIPSWAWRWFRIKRMIRTLWRMLRR